MTPAKILELDRARLRHLEMLALPTDKLAWLYSNRNRDPGNNNPEHGPVREAQAFMDLDLFRTYYISRKSLAAKEDEWDYSLLGAKADTGAWMAWAQGMIKRS